MPRRGHSLLESLVALTIMAALAALLIPAVQKVRAVADRTACQNNLRQIGLALHDFHDAHKQFPYARLCPAPWRNGTDLLCNALPSPDTYTGPNEVWWAPYDNRPGATSPAHCPTTRRGRPSCRSWRGRRRSSGARRVTTPPGAAPRTASRSR